MLLNVFWGLKMVFTPKGAHVFSSFSLTPLTYGRNIGLAVSSSASFSLDLGAEEKVLLIVLSGYLLAMKTSFWWCISACLCASYGGGGSGKVGIGPCGLAFYIQRWTTGSRIGWWVHLGRVSCHRPLSPWWAVCLGPVGLGVCNCAGPCGQMMKVSST